MYIWAGIFILHVEIWAEMIILQVENSLHPCLLEPTCLFYKFKKSPPEGLF